MKKTGWVLLIGLVFVFAGQASAAYGYECETPSCLSCPAGVDTDTNTQRQAWGLGGGLDVVLFRSGGLFDQVTFENRYDSNREYRGFLVGEIDLWKLLEK